MIKFPISQHIEIANALEDSGYDFIWVVRKTTEEAGEYAEILEEFEKRVKESNKGELQLIIDSSLEE
ncbi:Soyasapogenol B glucuronide galactosyltransferase [Trifolium repens]|nr:Soyasapogenol B glucuronide galactosyltransferase [Trifolium repens]